MGLATRQQVRILVREIYNDFGLEKSGSRDFGFKDQIQRAGISIMNNIAEGFERNSKAEFARFLDIARGSSGEVRSMYYTAQDLGYVTTEIAEKRKGLAKQISAGIKSLANHLRGQGISIAEAETSEALDSVRLDTDDYHY